MATGFNADAWAESREPWTFTSKGQVWRAAPISAPAVVDAFTAFAKAGEDAGEQHRILRRLLRLAFPWRLSMQWRGDPVDLILALPPGALDEAVTSFFEWAGKRTPATTTKKPSAPSSTPNSPPTTPTTDPATRELETDSR